MSSEGEAMRCVPRSVTIRNLWRDFPERNPTILSTLLWSQGGYPRSWALGIGHGPVPSRWPSVSAHVGVWVSGWGISALIGTKLTQVGSLGWKDPLEEGIAPVYLPGEFHGQRSLAGYSPCGHRESDVTDWLTQDKVPITVHSILLFVSKRRKSMSLTRYSKTACNFFTVFLPWPLTILPARWRYIHRDSDRKAQEDEPGQESPRSPVGPLQAQWGPGVW